MPTPSEPLYPSFLERPHQYDACPSCGNIKSKAGKLCRGCRKKIRPLVQQPDDQTYRLIPLTRGKLAIVDVSDYEWLNQWKWTSGKGRHGDCYAVRVAFPDGPARVVIKMHRLLLGLTEGGEHQGDHINKNTLDNRRSNLRGLIYIIPFR